jgi:hypothetical protein
MKLGGPLRPEPSLADLLENFADAIAVWAQDGFPLRTKAQVLECREICERCEFWNGEARLGLGECRHPSCGCTKIKHWLASEHCPKGLW